MAMDRRLLRVYQTEVKRQCVFALIAWQEMQMRLNNPEQGLAGIESDRFWTAMQTFLGACAVLSKLCWPSDTKWKGESPEDVTFRIERGKELRQSLSVADSSPLKNKEVRNCFEHIDERLDVWARHSPNRMLMSRCSGEPGSWVIESATAPTDWVGYLDRSTMEVTFQGMPVPLQPMVLAVIEMYNVVARLVP
jgi:hypothetical protein